MTLSTRCLTALLLPILLGASAVAHGTDAAGEDHPLCRPDAETAERVRHLEASFDACDRSSTCFEDALAAAARATAERPDDYFAHRAIQEGVRGYGGSDRTDRYDEVLAYYVHRARMFPDSALALHLAGRLAPNDEDLELQERALALDPDLPWAHFSRAQLLASLAWRSPDKDALTEQAQGSLVRFEELCPSQGYRGLGLSRSVGDDDFWRSRLEGLHRSLRNAPDEHRLRYSPRLWQLHFRLTPPAEHDGVREWVRRDLEEVTPLAEGERFRDDPAIWESLWEAYETADRPQRAEELRTTWQAGHPCTPAVERRRLDELGTDRLAQDPETIRANYERFGTWLEGCPDSDLYSMLRFNAATQLDDLPDDELIREYEARLAVWEGHGGRSGVTPWLAAVPAFLDRNIRVEEVPDLVHRHLDHVAAQNADQDLSGFPEELRERIRTAATQQRIYALGLLARAEIANDRPVRLPEEVTGVEPAAEDDEIVTGPPWEDRDEPLAAFELSDLSGATWTPADLAGKTVLLNAWATWCGPCRLELPMLQTLHERLADRDDVAVVLLNSDSDLGGVEPFVRKEGLTMPVLLAGDWMTETFGTFVLPTSWIVDGSGRVRAQQVGFGTLPEGGAEAWVDELLEKLESIATAQPPATGGSSPGGA